MSGSSPNHDVFDVRKIRRLVELMEEHDLAEIDLRQEDKRIQLRRGPTGVAAEPVAPSCAEPAPAVATSDKAAKPPADDTHSALITSPIVGTFYASPNPEAPPYVKVGDHVGPETTVCIIEAMKVFNEIPAEVSGKIVAVLARNGEPVEYGHPLFRVDTTG